MRNCKMPSQQQQQQKQHFALPDLLAAPQIKIIFIQYSYIYSILSLAYHASLKKNFFLKFKIFKL